MVNIDKLGPLALAILCLAMVVAVEGKTKKKEKKVEEPATAPLGQSHSFSLTKYQKPQQFSFLISCNQNALINFELSPRLKTLHKDIFLSVDFQIHDCIKAHQDTSRILINEESWDLVLENICCSKDNSTKVVNETIKVIVRDGFKILGLPIKTKVWNSVMPIFTSLCICVFVWFSNFSQPRAENISFLSRFYRQAKPKQEAEQKHMEISIDKVEIDQPQKQKQKQK